MIVVDASVAAKWVLPEAHDQTALKLRDYPDLLIAPDIARLEVTSAVTRRHRTGHFSEEDARLALEQWQNLLAKGAMHLVATDDLLAEAVDLALAIRHPLPDCLYLALAKRFDCPLVTADRTLIERGAAAHAKLRLLDEWPG